MPLSILEAWGCGLPVLSTPIDAIERLIEDITDPPIVFFLRNCKSFTAALHAIQKRAFDFLPVQQKIEREDVFRKIEAHYRRLCQ
jgi:glycosyltransferase involved in cell wall biosynthesis